MTSHLTHKRVWTLALPIMLANVSEPLLGLTDTAVVGQLGEEGLIGAVSIGALLFSFLFWAFGFLRYGTGGFAAQANGARDEKEIKAVLLRALSLAVVIGVLILALQYPAKLLTFWWFSLNSEIEEQVALYYDIRIWSAPATMISYVVLGWLVGLQRTGYVMMLQLFLNGSNIVLDIFFVLVLGWAVDGVAVATVISQWATLGLSLYFAIRLSPKLRIPIKEIFDAEKLTALLKTNFNIMLRTLFMIYAFASFNKESAKLSTNTLDANSILMHFSSLSAYALDGFAHAAEGLCGSAIGARKKLQLRDAFLKTTLWATLLSFMLTLGFWLFGHHLINMLTTNVEVRETAQVYLVWAIIMPIVSVWSFQFDGLFFAATRGAEIRNAMLVSLAAYLLSSWYLVGLFGNHGLWAALTIFMIVRALALAVYYPRLEASIPSSIEASGTKESA